jgi:hypothetical protein
LLTGEPRREKGCAVKKGRHRRFEEARELKRERAIETIVEECPECGNAGEHASWCRATEDEIDPYAEEEA